ncbi:413_t:CDS:2 [Diversispora eburnea]|uniref:413_t:CDS:1 n=1 Tax=Diversispora eburnea TaxID=1213867 RepID=A0A9N8WIH3_9GLOM|nr:413_t:CDS:2 [Diversispora eburnea]
MSSNGSSSNESTTPINIPTTLRNRHREPEEPATGGVSSLAQSFATNLQSWTQNSGQIMSTYMSDNIAVPSSVADSFDGAFSPMSNRYSPAQARLPDSYRSGNRSQYGSYMPASSYAPSLATISGSPIISHYGSSYFSNRQSPKVPYDKQIKDIPERTPLIRTTSKSSMTSVPLSTMQNIQIYEGSTFQQSIFNSCNILIGWVIGLGLFIFCFGVTNYTAKILVKCLEYDEGLYTYADMGAIAFGEGIRLLISILFSLELLASTTALVILCGDSLQAIFPDVSIIVLKLIAWSVMAPLTLMAIRYLSYFSLLGIFSAFALVSVLVIDGITKAERPGSLIDPMPTELFPSNWGSLPMAFGLIMAGFTGHAVFPSVYRDMQEPHKYNKMVDITYFVTASVYIVMAVCGYAMFGLTTMQEVTINPIAKYALMINPINLTLEIAYFSIPNIENWFNKGRGRRSAVKVISRMSVSLVVVLIAIQFPGFDRVMGILGSFFSYTISVVFPCMCYLKLFGRELSWKEYILNVVIIGISICLSALGTIWSFLP